MRKDRHQDRPWVTITYVRTNETDQEIADFTNTWKDKVNAIHISPQFDYLGRSQLSAMGYTVNSGDILSRNEKNRQPCRQLWLRLAVLSNGEIVPCSQNMDGELSLGNIRNISLADAWTGDVLADLRRQHMQNHFRDSCVCKSCIDWDWSGRIDKRPVIES
jgi:radical SAM protein with 4Fe4S-binding SPASM domain